MIINPYFFNSNPVLLLDCGQSNDGKGAMFSDVDWIAPYQGPYPEVQFYGDDGVFRSLVYSDAMSFQSPMDGSKQYANQAYLYAELAARLGCTSMNPLYVCAYSVGDTDLANDWSSTVPGAHYTTFVNRINACKASLLSLFSAPAAVFMCLMDQGEKDGRDSAKSTAYQTNKTNFVNNLRTAISEPNLKFFFPLLKLASINGTIPVNLGASINFANVAVAAADPTKIITQDTNYYEPSTDGVHFTVAGQTQKNIGTGATVGGQRWSQIQRLIDAGWISGSASPSIPSGQTYFNGVYGRVSFGDILDSVFTGATSVFRIGITVWNPPPYGFRCFFSKFSGGTGFTNQRTFLAYYSDTVIGFSYYRLGTSAQARTVTWTRPSSMFDGSEHTVEFRYDGTAGAGDDGLSRVALYYDGALYTTGKTLATTLGTLGTGLFSGTAHLGVASLIRSDGDRDGLNFIGGGWMKDFYVISGTSTVELNCPVLSTGTDTSGNGRNGTYTP